MSEIAQPDDLPRARTVRDRWPGLVWAIPLAALILVLILAVHAFINRGITAKVTFESATGIKVGDTKVIFQGYEIGHVTGMDVEKGTRRIVLTVLLDSRAKAIMRTGTLFWLVGEKPDLSNLASVKGAIAGPTIGLSPSFDGAPTRHFRGLAEEPAVMPGTPGTYYFLATDHLGGLKPRSSIRFRGDQIGKVTATGFAYPDTFRIKIFINRPFDRLIRPDTLFWQASGLDLSIGAGSVQASGVDPSALIGGGINVDTIKGSPLSPSRPNSVMRLYERRADAEAGPPGASFPYALVFPGSGGDLRSGAAVFLIGFQVGDVVSKRPCVDPSSEAPAACVIAELDSAKIAALVGSPAGSEGFDRAATDQMVARLIERGYRAELRQQPPIFGGMSIVLNQLRAGRAVGLVKGSPPGIPVSPSDANPGRQVKEILAKIDRIPFDRIGGDLTVSVEKLRAILSSPKLIDSLDHLHTTLANVDDITTQAKPQLANAIAALRDAATQASAAAGAARAAIAGDQAGSGAGLPAAIQQLTDAASSIRALADFLDRHPEALIKGKRTGSSKIRKAR